MAAETMAAEQRFLVPDERILSDIFPGVVGLKLSSCNVLSNTFDICTFSVQDEVIPLPVIQIGTVTTLDAQKVNYLVTEYLTGTILLEDIWNALNETDQLELVESIISAVNKLQKLGGVNDVSEYLMATPYITNNDTPITIGGPGIGYFRDIKDLLKSKYDDIGQIELSHSDLDELQRHVVFCHNDLEPRNILVRESPSGNYELAGIIDWEMAGFFPFAYEYGLKDTILGSNNLYFSWYALFKKRASYLLPQTECHTKLIRAIRIIEKSKKRGMARNVGVQVQAKWIQREKVEESSDIREGWVRKPLEAGKIIQVFTKEDMEELQNEVLKELGYI
ncbi:hypothetical protein N7454_001635 [Penicillium verhagenii]|nr:hypothetical protein N7454_001635 [Penicillium verhagenii]